MIIFVSLVITITAVPATRSIAAPFLAAMAGLAVLAIPLLAIAWFNESTPIGDFLVGSFQGISGLTSSRELYQECYNSPINSLLAGLFTLAVAPFGFIATIAVPVGVLATGGGALYVLATGKREALVTGVQILAAGLACTVAAGLILRFIHYFSGLDC